MQTHRKVDERKGLRIIVNVARVIVGILFIFSGLVKANDPLGLSYKMQEFFEVWAQTPALTNLMHWLDNYALAFSIIMITLEIVAGIALLLGWSRRFISWLLLLLIIFFTFLTGYAVLSGKIRTCGCFGDCIPLTAMQSFMKDIVLLVLTFILVAGARYINPVMRRGGVWLMFLSTVAVLLFQWYVLWHSPVWDCLPYKKGNNLLELRKMPADAVPDKVDFKFVYSKNGKEQEFSKDKMPDSTWTFVRREDIILEKGKNNEPPIKDFYINTLGGADTTEALLSQQGYYYLLFVKDPNTNAVKWKEKFDYILPIAKKMNRPVYVVSSQTSLADEFFNTTYHYNLPLFSLDVTALKTASRTDPSIYLMKGPVVQGKWGWGDMKKAVDK